MTKRQISPNEQEKIDFQVKIKSHRMNDGDLQVFLEARKT